MISSSSTEIVVEQPTTGLRTTITGTGLVHDGNGALVEAGTITGLSFANAALVGLATITGLNWDMATFHAGLAASAAGDNSILDALFASQPVTLDLTQAGAYFSTASLDPYVNNYVTTYIGNAGDDYIYGGNNLLDRTVHGNGGNDQLITYGGDDTVFGGDGNDNLQTAGGKDSLEGGVGNDMLRGAMTTTRCSAASATTILTAGQATTCWTAVTAPIP